MKQMITKYTNHLYWDCAKLTQIRDEINRLIVCYGEDTKLDIEYDSYDNTINLKAFYKVEETDEEYQERINKENELKEYRRREYEKLKREFENE